MSSQPTLTTPLNPAVDESRWVRQIRSFLDEENEDDTGIPVSIANVPKQLLATKPEAYIPQEVAIGPYHYWRPELYEMERYKISAAKRVQKRLVSSDFQTLVQHFVKLEPKIRSNYHHYLNYSGETLAWMTAIDAAFLLEFISIFTAKDGKVLEQISSRMSYLMDSSGTKSPHNAILRDIMMLENQIPLFLLRKILCSQVPSSEEADEQLTKTLTGLCREISPFKTIANLGKIQAMECAHLLELLYCVVVPVSKVKAMAAAEESNDQDVKIEVIIVEECVKEEGPVWKVVQMVWVPLSSLAARPVHLMKHAVTSRIVVVLVKLPCKIIKKFSRVLVQLPWKILGSLPGFKLLKKPIESLFMSEEMKDGQPEEGNSDCNALCSRPPSIEEIKIPSVSDLVKMGVKFVPTKGDLSTISFDEKTLTLHLPTVTLDVNSEVILRNLVAYEASIVSGPVIFTRYTELMNGIIDTEEDAKLLRESGIVFNFLKNDEEVANLCNGMCKSLKLTKVPWLDNVVEDVNRCYSRRWKVKIEKFMKSHVFGSWQCLTFLAAILLLVMTGLQAFCSVYACARWFDGTE